MKIKEGVTGIGNSQRLYRFSNGYGASVVCGQYTYGGKEGLLELAVIKFEGDDDSDFDLVYDTTITDNVIGYLTDEQVQVILEQIEALPEKESE